MQEADAAVYASTLHAAIHALNGDIDRYREISKYYKDKITQLQFRLDEHCHIARETSAALIAVREDVSRFKETASQNSVALAVFSADVARFEAAEKPEKPEKP